MEGKVHCAFRSRGETWVLDAEIGFVRILSIKHREAGAEGCWAEEYLSWAWQPTQWTQEGKGSFSEGTVLKRDWPWLVENRLWNYPSWDNNKKKKNTVRGKVWSLEQDCWDLVIQMTLSKFLHLSEPQFPHLWIGNSIS